MTERRCSRTAATLLLLTACGLPGAGAALAQTAPAGALSSADQDKARDYIVASEGQWVAAVVSGKTDDVSRIWADDIVDVDTSGHLIDKATMLAQIKAAPQFFATNKLDGVKVRFFGTTAVSQGSETWEGRNGLPKQGQFAFTDTWVMRDGQWQVVATEALVPMEPGK